jgi:hypothetical protein
MLPPTSAAVLRAVADAWEMTVETITSPARAADWRGTLFDDAA